MTVLLLFLLGGIAGRLRGAGLVSDILARFGIWGGSVGLLVLWATQDSIYAMAALILAGVGASFGYWGDFDLTLPANRTWINFWKLSAMGCMRFAPLFAASVFASMQWEVLPSVLAGFSFYPSYWLGIKMQNVKLPLLANFTEWGEFLFWGTIYMVLGCFIF